MTVRIGVMGARSMIARLALYEAIEQSPHAVTSAVAAASGPVPAGLAHLDVGTYDNLLTSDDVDAIYIALPNHLHRPWAEAAMRSGKHVLCEKPLALDTSEAQSMYQTAGDAGVLLAEAFVTPFDERFSTMMALADRGEVGDVRTIDAAFTFTIGPESAANYRWNPAHGGGALADVGIYCLGPVAHLWGLRPDELAASVQWSAVQAGAQAPVDATTAATLRWRDGRSASIRCSFVEAEQQRLEITGEKGTMVIEPQAFTGGREAIEIRIDRSGEPSTTVMVEADNPYRRMVDAFACAAAGRDRWARSEATTLEALQLCEQIAAVANTEEASTSTAEIER